VWFLGDEDRDEKCCQALNRTLGSLVVLLPWWRR
jgi:hypothetical protein